MKVLIGEDGDRARAWDCARDFAQLLKLRFQLTAFPFLYDIPPEPEGGEWRHLLGVDLSNPMRLVEVDEHGIDAFDFVMNMEASHEAWLRGWRTRDGTGT